MSTATDDRVTLLLKDGSTVSGVYLGTRFNTMLAIRLDTGAVKHVRMAELAQQDAVH